ncbi:copper amine oxidase N-terminal domain-containing protein [Peptoniphilus asaccharolyticus]
MKKRILSIVMMLAVVMSLVGCTPNVAAYLEKTKEVQNWEGSKISGQAEVKVSFKDEQGKAQEVKMPMTVSGVSEGKEKAEVKVSMDMTAIKKMAPAEEAEEAMKMIPDKFEMHMFVDGSKIYINKDYFKAMAMGNKEALANIKEDYILLSTDEENSVAMMPQKAVMEYVNSAEFNADIMSILNKALEGYKPVVDMKVEGNKFTYEATSDQMAQEIINSVTTIVANWDKVSGDIYKLANKMEAGVDEATIKEAVKEFKKDDFAKSVNEAKETIKGSSLKSSIDFKEGKYLQEMVLDLKVKDMFNMVMTMKSEAVKDDSVKVMIPKSVKKLTSEEYMDLIFHMDKTPIINVRVNAEDLVFEDQQPTIVEGRTLVPFRALLEKLGAKVEWNEKTQTVTATKADKTIVLKIGSNKATVDGKEVTLDVPAVIENGRTIVPLRFLSENLGYKVKFDAEMAPFYVIDIYNTTDEKLAETLKAKEEAMIAEFEKMEKESLEKANKTEKANSVGIIGGKDSETKIKVK